MQQQKTCAISRNVMTYWSHGTRKIVEENSNGTFNITDWHMLDEDGLKKVHETIGEVLTDLAARRQLEDHELTQRAIDETASKSLPF